MNFTSARHFFVRGLPPSRWHGMTVAFIISAIDMALIRSTGFTTFGPIGGVPDRRLCMLATRRAAMIACAVRFRAYFRGENPEADTSDPGARHGRGAGSSPE